MASEGHAISGQARLTLSGRFTFADYERFRPLLDTIRAGAGTRHVVDLEAVEFIDSAGLGMLLLALDEANSRGAHIVLGRPRGQVWKTLHAARLDEVFTIER